MKTSITYYPNKQKQSKRTGKVPLYARVYFNSLKAEERLNAEVAEKDIAKWDSMSMRFSDRTIAANKILNSLDKRFEEFLIINASSLSKFHPRQIIDYVLGRETERRKEVKVTCYLDDYFTKVVLPNSELSAGTIRNYRKSINHLKAFLKLNGIEDLLLSELDNSTTLKFKDYLQSAEPSIHKKAMTEVSASSVLKNFKPLFNRAIDEGHLEKNPFKALKLKHKSPRRDRLNINQVKALCDLDLSRFPAQKAYRDIFLFCVFTGLAYKDAISLKGINLEERKDGSFKLHIKRSKTDIQTECFLVTQAIRIVKHYKEARENQITGLVLPKRSNEKLNVQLKILAEMVNIPINLSSHIARHTHRQLLSEAGIEDRGVIKRMMGHSGSGDIDSVYYSITESRLREAKQKFEKFLKKHLEARL